MLCLTERVDVGVQVDCVLQGPRFSRRGDHEPDWGLILPARVDERNLDRVDDGLDVPGRGGALRTEDRGHALLQQRTRLPLGGETEHRQVGQ